MDGKIEELKKEKRTLKTSITKLLNELAAELSTKTPNKENVTGKLQDIDKRRDELLELLDSLQTLYGDNKHASLAASTGDEADKMIDRVDNETKEARLFLSQSNSKESEGNNTSQIGTFESAHCKDGHVVDANKQLERIRIPKFSGDKKEYQSWWAAFSSCVDETNLSAQFKMLRLESCLVGEAAETVKGLGYSDHAYEAAKARLNRKYGGNRRQVQAHIDELRKMRPINADNPRELERFADIVERTVVSLKENKKFADLEGGTLYAIVLEKLPQTLLSQYYRWIKEKGSLESLEELRRWVAEEAEYQVQASEIKHGLSSVGSVRGKSSTKSYFGTTEEKRDRPCKVCDQKHPIWKCDMFKGMEHRKKWETAKKLGLCYRCLGKGHLGDSCTWNRECGIDGCKDRHHRLLHEEKVASGSMEGKADTPVTEENKSSTYETVQEHTQRSIALRTVPVILKHGEKRLQVNCFLDEGSDTSYVNEDVVEELGLYGRKEKVIINVANGQKVNLMSATMEIGLESLDGRVDTVIVAKTSNNICGGMKPTNWLQIKDQWKHLRDIPFPKLGKRTKIGVLIGSDYYNLLFPMKEVRGGDNEPSARLCPLGWTAIGTIGTSEGLGTSNTGYLNTYRIRQSECNDGDLNYLLKQFWSLEAIGITPQVEQPFSPEEKLAFDKVNESIRFDGERYAVAVPWKHERPELPPNRQMAERRLHTVEKKLMQDEKLAQAYQSVVDDYLSKGYIREVPDDEPKPPSEWFLPHFPVVRPEKATTKVRVVFDGSAQQNGKSLNSESLPGPKLQSDIVDVLVKFRKEPVALAGDVSQMYHQILLRPEDRALHRFLYRNLDSGYTPKVYEFKRFIFGGCYCPFCVQFAWQHHARLYKETYPLGAKAVLEHCYMDDLMPSAPTVDDAKDTRKQLTELGDLAGFHIRKWISNEPDVIADIAEEDLASEIDLEKRELPTTKTLGVLWAATDDKFSFRHSLQLDGFEFTKRNVLRRTASVYDPLGFLSPYVIRSKLLIQKAWLEARDWDELLPTHHQREWTKWFRELKDLELVKIPRCLKDPSPKVEELSIHTFSDASENAYTAVVYARHVYEGGNITARMIMSKSRLAPLKAVSIPRLELLGALVGLRLTRQVCSALKIPTNGVTYWVDSMNVGYWIQGQSREYKPFIAHRVGEIHEFSAPNQWRYVPTDVNPADLGTRGLTVEELASADLWWNGPEFLKKSRQDWPECKFDKPTSTDNLELKGTKESGTKDATSYQIIGEGEETASVKEVWRLDPSRYSKWYRVKTKGELEIGLSLVRVTAWVRRFTDNCRKPAEQREKGELKPLELQNAEEFIIREVQSKVYSAEIEPLRRNKEILRGSTLAPFNPVLVNGILRSNTRLRHADDLPYDVKCPIILPKRNHVTGLIVKYYHELEGHQMGLNYTINHVREKYLVVHVREQVKRVMRECFECARRFRSKPAHQQMAPLPKIRLQQSSRPFESCAVDFGGPFLTKQGRGRVRAKRYLCLFLCLKTHCCHLEMASSLDTDAFLNAFVRMTARRGWPQQMLSDNGTNFVSASRELRDLVSAIDQDKIQRMTSNKGVSWKWNPPAAPHFGGVFESMIKSAKRAIFAVLGDAEVNDEELETIFIGVESLLNSRPLTAVSDDPNDDRVLTPNHFLIGQIGGDFVPESVDTEPFNPRKRWRRLQELPRHVWNRWMKEYLPQIGSRQKWYFRNDNLRVGDVVVVIDPGTVRRQWNVGRIEQTYPGPDGLVRVVDVRVNGKTLKRPITRISPLEIRDTEL